MSRVSGCPRFKKVFLALIFAAGMFFIPNGVQSATNNSATLQWAPNQESDLAGYRVYHGTTSGAYNTSQNAGNTTIYKYVNLDSTKNHYFAVTAYDKSGNESSPSVEVSKKILIPNSLLSVSINGGGTVTSSPVGVSCSSGTCSGSFPQGSSVTLTAIPKSGSMFSGWSGACTGASACVVALATLSASVSATFAASPPHSSSLSVTLAGRGSGVVSSNPTGVSCSNGTCSSTFPQGSSVTLTATPKNGSTFSGWSGACTGVSTCVVALATSSASVSANFALRQTVSRSLTVSLTGDGKGNVTSKPSGLTCSGGTCVGSFPQGTTVTLTPVTQSGTVFQGWNGLCNGTSSCTVTLSSAKAVTAVFALENSSPPPMPNLPFLVNFQAPASQVPSNFKKDDGSVFNTTRGYGWNKILNGTEKQSTADQTLDTFVSAANLNPSMWKFVIPNGIYYVTMVLGDPSNAQGPHWVEAEGLQLAKQVKTSKGEYLAIVDYPVEVKDSTLSITLGKSGQGQTTLNYLLINEKPNLSNTDQILTQSFGTTLVASVLSPGIATKINPIVLVKKDREEKARKKKALAQEKALAKKRALAQKKALAREKAIARWKKVKERERAKLNGIKEKVLAKRKAGGTISLRNLLGGSR